MGPSVLPCRLTKWGHSKRILNVYQKVTLHRNCWYLVFPFQIYSELQVKVTGKERGRHCVPKWTQWPELEWSETLTFWQVSEALRLFLFAAFPGALIGNWIGSGAPKPARCLSQQFYPLSHNACPKLWILKICNKTGIKNCKQCMYKKIRHYVNSEKINTALGSLCSKQNHHHCSALSEATQ